jgi:hypothetical protein
MFYDKHNLDKLGIKSLGVVVVLLQAPYWKRRVIQGWEGVQWAVRNDNYNAVWAP